jgi:hypothetical protein
MGAAVSNRRIGAWKAPLLFGVRSQYGARERLPSIKLNIQSGLLGL